VARNRPSVQKRNKEAAKREKKQAKAARKAARDAEKDEVEEVLTGTDKDLDGIVAGPQPPRDDEMLDLWGTAPTGDES
jgi:hypothetical protein